MHLTMLSGSVTHCRVVSNTSGHISAKHGGSVRTSHVTVFRVAGKPVEMGGVVSVDNGDEVTVAGLPGGQGLKAIGLRDNRSGVTALVPADKRNLFAGILSLFAGFSCGSLMAMDSGVAGFLWLLVLGGTAAFFLRRFYDDRKRIEAAAAMLQQGALEPAPA